MSWLEFKHPSIRSLTRFHCALGPMLNREGVDGAEAQGLSLEFMDRCGRQLSRARVE